MEANARELEELNKSWEQKLAESKAKEEEEKRKEEEEREARNSGRP